MAHLLALGPQWVLSREHHRGSPSAEPGIVVRAFGADNAADGHEETVKKDYQLLGSLKAKAMERQGIPKHPAGTKHVLAQGTHDAVRAGAVLEDRDASFAV